MNFSKIAVKSIGIVSAGILASDVYKSGVSRGTREAKGQIGDSLTDIYINHGSTNSSSRVLNATTKWYRKQALDDKFFSGINTVVNITKQIFNKTVDNIIPVHLGLGGSIIGDVSIGTYLLLGGGVLGLIGGIMGPDDF